LWIYFQFNGNDKADYGFGKGSEPLPPVFPGGLSFGAMTSSVQDVMLIALTKERRQIKMIFFMRKWVYFFKLVFGSF
jgi:hypothetical protein